MDEDPEEEENSGTVDTVVKVIPMEKELSGSSIISTLGEEDLISIGEEVKESCASRAGMYAKIILPHIGLVLLLGAYTLCGAGIFHMIELPHEEQVRNKALHRIAATKSSLLDVLYNKSAFEIRDELTWKSVAFSQFKILEKVLYRAYEDEFVNLDDIARNLNETNHRQMWTITQAIFFSTTVITTIGYGNLVPRTLAGRIFCIVFALFGIPLLLVTVADIGKFLADLMKFLYKSYQSFKWKLKQTRRRFLEYRLKEKRNATFPAMKAPRSKAEMRLPWIMVMLVLVTYTGAGAILFHIYEGWDYFESFYFCFITMATVGFGDIVPTQEVYMFFTIAYIVIGLALTTMCIDLAGLEYVAKIHSFGRKIDAAKGMVGGAVVSGLHVGENLLRIRAVGRRNFDAMGLPAGMTEEQYLLLRRQGLGSLSYNVLTSPISPEVERLLKPHIKIRMNELKESDAYIVENMMFNKPLGAPSDQMTRRRQRRGGRSRREMKYRLSRSHSYPKRPPFTQDDILIIAPFLVKESDV